MSDKGIDFASLELPWRETLATTSTSPLVKYSGVRSVSIGIIRGQQAWIWSVDENRKVSNEYLENFIRRVRDYENPQVRKQLDAMLERIGAHPIRDRRRAR